MLAIITFFNKYGGYLVLILAMVFAALYMSECQKRKTAIEIAEGNAKALKDSTIQLKTTKEQLHLFDQELAYSLDVIDSLKGIEPETITQIKIVYRDRPDTVDNKLSVDSTGLYTLSFSSDDSLRTIEGDSKFRVSIQEDSLRIKPNVTIINKFSLNFGLLISEYRDEEEKVDRIDITPFYLDENGNFTNIPVPDSKLTIPFRGAEILKNPYQTNVQPSAGIRYGWAIGINPISAGIFLTPKGVTYGIGPSISLTYYLSK